MLTVTQLSCSRHQRCLFSNLDFNISPKGILHVIGPNGAGKSSLLQLLCGLLLPQAGNIQWNGLSIHHAESNYKHNLAYLGHKIGVKQHLTVAENLKIAVKLTQEKANWENALDCLEITKLKNTQCQYLSAGQRQRVALARIVATQAPLWILDEPYTALDTKVHAIFQNILFEHCAQGGLAVITSHQPIQWPGESQQLYLTPLFYY